MDNNCKRERSSAELLYLAFKLILRNEWFRFIFGLSVLFCSVAFTLYICAWAIKQNPGINELWKFLNDRI